MFWGDEPTHEGEPTEYRQNGVYFIFNAEGKILVTQSPAEAKKGLWSVPQGGIKKGESLVRNLEREVTEEFLDLDPRDLSRIETSIAEVFTQDYNPERLEEEQAKGRNFRGKQYHSSAALYVGAHRPTPNPEEITRCEFVSPQEAQRRFSGNKEKYTMLIAGLKRGIEIYYK